MLCRLVAVALNIFHYSYFCANNFHYIKLYSYMKVFPLCIMGHYLALVYSNR